MKELNSFSHFQIHHDCYEIYKYKKVQICKHKDLARIEHFYFGLWDHQLR